MCDCPVSEQYCLWIFAFSFFSAVFDNQTIFVRLHDLFKSLKLTKESVLGISELPGHEVPGVVVWLLLFTEGWGGKCSEIS